MKRIIGNDGTPSKKNRAPPPKRVSDKPHAEYEYAINEYYQTVSPHHANDDGRNHHFVYPTNGEPRMAESSRRRKTETSTTTPTKKKAFPIPRGGIMPSIQEQRSSSGDSNNTTYYHHHNNNAAGYQTPNKRASSDVLLGDGGGGSTPISSIPNMNDNDNDNDDSPTLEYVSMSSPTDSANSNTPGDTNNSNNDSNEYGYDDDDTNNNYASIEATMPDATYEEFYGDAYVGAPIKYIYPAGYQTMRPRGGPWKLSIVICVLFTWLSIFIVGHCSDRSAAGNDDNNNNNNDNNNNNGMDDDTYVIETRWCGSKLLYFMWVMSMLITGLAAAYCSVIGYIKIRDFAVANLRSQPPGMVGKSDYYVTIDDNQRTGADYYKKTIYQADGTPQFWGGNIYRPTQAAVAVTSR